MPKKMIIYFGICAFLSLTVFGPVASLNVQYITFKTELLFENESETMLGSDLILTEKEMKANNHIMDLKHQLLDQCKNNGVCYYTKHFFLYKDEVPKLELFKIIKDMPKGALLHVHDTSIMDPDYVLRLTYWDNLYACLANDGENIIFKFSTVSPNDTCSTEWQLMADIRNNLSNVTEFDSNLRKQFTIVVDNPDAAYFNNLWTVFQNYFTITTPLLTYKPVWEQYFFDAMNYIRSDNLMYMEMRSVLPELYDLEGNVYDAMTTAETLRKTSSNFVTEYPDFYGMKLIYAPSRMVTIEIVEDYIKIARQLKTTMPDFFSGFDLVGNEDTMPLKAFRQILAEASDDIDYFFHAGETAWNGFEVDENLFDAIALGTKRIGHGIALSKHPVLIDAVKRNRIPIEINPISNTIGGATDLRAHPLAMFLAQGLPIDISSDDPGVWESMPLTHDLMACFVGASNRHADLKLLKKLAINSLEFSTATNKAEIICEFHKRWDAFIDLLLERIESNYYL